MARPTTCCHACGARGLMPFYEQRNLPVSHQVLLPTRAEALSYPRGDVRLGFCSRCGFIQNMLFDGRRLEYSPRTGMAHSSRFEAFVSELADSLIERYNLRGKSILEIGCGNGEFLELICERGGNLGVGIDPVAPEGPSGSQPIHYIRDLFSEDYLSQKADFICSRHMLDHAGPVHDFVGLIRRSIGNDHEPVIFFEVQDVRRTLSRLASWDVYYEHCSYFSSGSLARLVRASDFNVFDLRRAYGDQYLLIDAVASSGDHEPVWEMENDISELQRLVAYFRDNSATRLHEWSQRLQRLRNEGSKVVVWGSSAKAAAFLTAINGGESIEYVVDINSSGQGRYVAGSGQEVVPPEFMSDYRPDAVIVLDESSADEVDAALLRQGIPAQVISI